MDNPQLGGDDELDNLSNVKPISHDVEPKVGAPASAAVAGANEALGNKESYVSNLASTKTRVHNAVAWTIAQLVMIRKRTPPIKSDFQEGFDEKKSDEITKDHWKVSNEKLS